MSIGKYLRRFSFSCLHVACMYVVCLPVSVIANDVVQIRFANDAALPGITRVSDKRVVVSFNDPRLKDIFSRYVIESCVQSYPMIDAIPHKLTPALSRVYEFVLQSGGVELIKQLKEIPG
ncbi:MAG TPA: hypothetical protein VFZ47_04205, partial [Chitinophagaceae bacterium]